MKKKLYLIALLPNDEIQKEVRAFKAYAAAHFQSKKALNSPPHITLQPPFKWNEDDLVSIKKAIRSVAKVHYPFTIHLANFNSFPPRVIYVDVVESGALAALQGDISQLMEREFSITDKYKDRLFHPHLTVAFRDLRKKIYPAAWKHFAEIQFERSFIVTEITMLKHNGARWEPFEKFPLGK